MQGLDAVLECDEVLETDFLEGNSNREVIEEETIFSQADLLVDDEIQGLGDKWYTEEALPLGYLFGVEQLE